MLVMYAPYIETTMVSEYASSGKTKLAENVNMRKRSVCSQKLNQLNHDVTQYYCSALLLYTLKIKFPDPRFGICNAKVLLAPALM